LFFFIIRSGA